MEYTTLSLAAVQFGLEAVAEDVQATFGRLDVHHLNWKPDAKQWSVAQCFDHLLMANGLMLRAAANALDDTQSRTVWQRLPIVPGVFGRMLIRSQAPQSTRRFTASPLATPGASDLPADIVNRFIVQNRESGSWVHTLDAERQRRIMTSPFVTFITYSLLDGARLILAHDHRHIEQARRVMQMPGFA